ncbi:hypothetical protein EHM69_11365 [candidate division KSB1 bacterium]|nr:MAG: hypothetical protein EHM69_11365 [candidate division KSB1 bacterium]
MVDRTTAESSVAAYMRSVQKCWSSEESEHALELARSMPIPSRFEEDWRRTDPEEFPWNRLEEVDPQHTKLDVSLRASGASSTGLVPLEVDGCARCRALHLIAGDDYDAKFLYYHKALNREPVCFRVMRDFRGDPVEIVQRASGPGLAAFTTVLVVEPGADVTLYDRWEIGDGPVAAIGRTEIMLLEGAKLTLLQEEQSWSVPFYRRARVQLERNAQLNWYAATPGAPWHAARMEIMMNGPGSEATYKGLFAGSGKARADHRTHQIHNTPNAKSSLMMKTLLAGQAHSVYQGTITVPQQGQKTDAYQQCRNLLLSPQAHADAIPKLEIIADDVRCSHGASMGPVNKDQLFYLRTRGLTRRQASVAIATGFAEEVIRNVPAESAQERWREMVRATIGKD